MKQAKYLQVKVMCNSCGQHWPQVLNRHLNDIECRHCYQKGVSVIYINEKDVEQWQADIENVEHTYNAINKEVLHQLEALELVHS